jgi:hypothetical protein
MNDKYKGKNCFGMKRLAEMQELAGDQLREIILQTSSDIYEIVKLKCKGNTILITLVFHHLLKTAVCASLNALDDGKDIDKELDRYLKDFKEDILKTYNNFKYEGE